MAKRGRKRLSERPAGETGAIGNQKSKVNVSVWGMGKGVGTTWVWDAGATKGGGGRCEKRGCGRRGGAGYDVSEDRWSVRECGGQVGEETAVREARAK